MTLDTYADLFDDDLDLVGDAMNRMLLEKNVGKMWAKKKQSRMIVGSCGPWRVELRGIEHVAHAPGCYELSRFPLCE